MTAARFTEHGRTVREVLPRLSVGEVTVRRPDGEEILRRYLHTPRAVAVVAVDGEELILIREYRAAVGDWVIQVPMGKVDGGRDSPTCARGELVEETGYVADEWAHVGTMYSCPGWMDQEMDVYLATGLRSGPDAAGDADDYEESSIEVLRVKRGDFVAGVRSGEIRDARSIAAVQIALG